MAVKEKLKTIYVCSNCGEVTPRWLGKCPSCGEWNTLCEDVVAEERPGTRMGGAGKGRTASAARKRAASSQG